MEARRSSGGSSGVSSPSLSAPLIAQRFRLWLLFHVLAAASSPGSLAMFARLASSRVRLIARQAVRRGDYVGNGGSGSARLALANDVHDPEPTRRPNFAVMHKSVFSTMW